MWCEPSVARVCRIEPGSRAHDRDRAAVPERRRIMIGRMASDAEAAAQALSPGALVADRYRVESILGQGGMGAVYRVCEQRTGREYALKQLRIAGANAPAAALMSSQFEREYHTLC